MIKHFLKKSNFALGRDPIIQKNSEGCKYVPEPFRSVLLLSADFELAWAWRYSKSSPNPIERATLKAQTERENIPIILKLCDQYNIPITWFTVGHLFLKNCKKINGVPHPELPRIQNFENEWWRFNGTDWFEHDPCSDYKSDPLWYCPDLIEQINNSKVKHEIGCHTFSHINCDDDICPPELMKSELRECNKVAADIGLELKSFVHPGHIIGNLNVLAKEGFTNFRTDYRNTLGYPKKHENGLWEIEQTAEFVYRKEWSLDYQIYRYIKIIKRAIKSKTLSVFWFHPSFNPIVVEKIWPEVFGFLEANKDMIWLSTHSEYVKWLESSS